MQRILGVSCSYGLHDCEPQVSFSVIPEDVQCVGAVLWDEEEVGKFPFLSHLKKSPPKTAGFWDRWQVSPMP